MDVIFLRSNELNWEENFQRTCDVIGENNVILLNGSGATSIKNAYQIVFDKVRSDYFMMIEADNFIFDNVIDFLDVHDSIKFWTTNKYNVQYEHGGIKIMNRDQCNKQIISNAHIYENFEISANLFLTSNYTVLSDHRFDWSPKNEWVTIAKEQIKLLLWGHTDHLDRWIAAERPAEIYQDVLSILKGVGFTRLMDTLLPSLGEIYDNKFKK